MYYNRLQQSATKLMKYFKGGEKTSTLSSI